MRTATGLRATFAVLAVTLLAGCGSSGSTSTSGGTAPGNSGSSAGSPAKASANTASGPFDICGLATPAQVSAIVGSTVAVAETSGGSHCDYRSDDRAAVTPIFDDNSDRPYDQVKGGDAILGGPTRELSGVGDHAFVATGKFAGHNAATSAVAGGGHIVHVTLTSSTRTPTQLGVIAEKLAKVIATTL